MKVGAIIAAAGFGRRMKADRPKQLLELNGTPIIIHTIRKFDASPAVEYTLTREHLVLAQTPQAFRTDVLKQAFARAQKDEYYGTDESSLVERIGHPVAIVRGSERNIKITRPSDLTLARAFLEEEK